MKWIDIRTTPPPPNEIILIKTTDGDYWTGELFQSGLIRSNLDLLPITNAEKYIKIGDIKK